MKTYLLISMMLVMSCNSTPEKNQERDKSAQKSTETSSDPKYSHDSSLQQNGDYTSLFIRDGKDCALISQSEMATLLNLNESDINPRESNYGFCWYDLTLNDVSKTSLGLHLLIGKKKDVTQQINSFKKMETDFGKNNSEGIVLMSDSNDTYFGIRSARGELFMLNPYYDNGILILFGSVVEAATKKITYTEEQKKERFDNAVAVANFLLKKYKK
jgi:hypothetical protein